MFNVYDAVADELRNYAEKNGVPLSRLIKDAIESYTGIPVGTKKENNKAEEDNA